MWLCHLFVCVRYVSTNVSHSDDLPCCGTFLLHQGIQRRVAMVVVQDGRTELQWTQVHALTIGCVRNTQEWRPTDGDQGILVLNATVVPCARQREDTRYSKDFFSTCSDMVAVVQSRGHAG